MDFIFWRAEKAMAEDKLALITAKRDKARDELSSLKTEMKKIEEEVREVEKVAEMADEKVAEMADEKESLVKKCSMLNERVTQCTLKVDGVVVSRGLAADALKDGNRELAKELAVLLVRRKACVKNLLVLGTRIEDVERRLCKAQA